MAATDTSLAPQTATPDQWEQALYAFVAEKERRSGSLRTVQSYSRMLRHFFGTRGKTPDRVTSPEVLSWARWPRLSGRPPSATTIGARDHLSFPPLPRFGRRAPRNRATVFWIPRHTVGRCRAFVAPKWDMKLLATGL